LDFEVAELRVAEFVDECFGSDGCAISKQEQLLRVLEKADIDGEDVTVIANAKYREAAEELELEFVEASRESFRKIFISELG